MAQYLLDTSEIEQIVRTAITDLQGVCFDAEATSAVQRLVDGYNVEQTTGLLDQLVKPWAGSIEDYAPLDRIVDGFTQMVERGLDRATHVAVLDYLPTEEALLVTHQPKPAPDPVKHLKDEYQHATMQGDFYPERIRRALDELAARI